MSLRLLLRFALTSPLLWLSACAVPPFDGLGKRCSDTARCPAGLRCERLPGETEGVCALESGEPTPPLPPGPENTGVPPGVTLGPSPGFRVDEEGAVVEGLDVDGCVSVNANNVTLRRMRIRCSGLYVLRVIDGFTGTLVEDVELDGLGSADTKGMVGSDVTVRRVNVHGSSVGIVLESRSLYERSYLHDLVGGNVAMWMAGGEGVVVRENRILAQPVSEGGIYLRGALAPVQDVSVEGNWLEGGDYGLWMSGNGPGGSATHPAQALTVRGNRFGRSFARRAADASGVTGLTWEDNVYDDTGEPIPAPDVP